MSCKTLLSLRHLFKLAPFLENETGTGFSVQVILKSRAQLPKHFIIWKTLVQIYIFSKLQEMVNVVAV